MQGGQLPPQVNLQSARGTYTRSDPRWGWWVWLAKLTNPSTDRFEYTCPVRYTESDLRCGWLGLRTVESLVLTTHAVYSCHESADYHTTSARMRWLLHGLTCACILSANNDDYDDELSTESLLKKICVPLCMLRNAPECSSEHLKLPKFPGGSMPPDPPILNSCRAPMFSTLANDIAPLHGTSYVRPWAFQCSFSLTSSIHLANATR